MWDGRFEISVCRSATIRPSGQVRSALSDDMREALLSLPVSLRAALPAVTPDGAAPVLPAGDYPDDTGRGGIKFACWVMPRFLAACGVFACESDCSRMREKPQ